MLTDPHGTSPLTKAIVGCAIRVQPVGLLINFNVPMLVDGVTRIVNPHVLERPDDGERAQRAAAG